MNIVSFGGGTNSTAMLIGLRNEGIKVDVILFADPGSEMPETYAHVKQIDEWLVKNNMPTITVVRRMWKHDGEKTLYQECVENSILPSIAYGGFKTCSINYKIKPQEKWCNNNDQCKEVWANGEKVNRYIGYDYGEPQRREHAKVYDIVNKKYKNHYPMVDDWEWDREDCKRIILAEGLQLPGKSSCFFCPNMRPVEVIDLKEFQPELYEEALYMESSANLTKLKGLGRQWSWKELGETYDQLKTDELTKEETIIMAKKLMKDKAKQINGQTSLCDFMDEPNMPCGCYD